MECDVIPDCAQEVDPLGSVENCNAIPSESNLYMGSLNAPVTASEPFSIKASNRKAITITQIASISGTQKMPKELTQQSKVLKHQQQALRKQMPRTVYRTPATSASAVATFAASTTTTTTLSAMTLGQPSSTAVCTASTSTSHGSGANRVLTSNTNTNSRTIHSVPTQSATKSTKSSSASPKSAHAQASTMYEVLSSIPGFSFKSRRRPYKKMSTAAQIEQTREGCIDLETPDSILVGFSSLRDLLNKDTFCLLPPLYQYKLIQLLPSVDRPPNIDHSDVKFDPMEPIRLNPSSLNNVFFSRACTDWRDRLAEGN